MTDLQHDDRGRRSRGDDRARRDDVRLWFIENARPRCAASDGELDEGLRSPGASCAATTAREFDKEITDRRERDQPAWSPGARTRSMVRRRHRERTVARGVRQPDREVDERALHYMGLSRRHPDRGDHARPRVHRLLHELADRRPARRREHGRRAARSPTSVYAMVVPGSQQVKKQAEEEGLDEVFRAAGFDWREAGCSMCLGMNPDIAALRASAVASTSNRNFEGRQGRRRALAPRLSPDGRRRGDRGPFRRHPRVG